MHPGTSTAFRSPILIFGIPLLIILASVFLAVSPILEGNPEIATGITLDLVLTAPLVYFLLIRKTTIPKTTVLPVFIAGLIIGSLILPDHQQHALSLVKAYVLPCVEIGVLIFLMVQVHRIRQSFKMSGKSEGDVLDALKASVTAHFGASRAGQILASEVAMIYYMLVFRRPKPRTGFTAHKENGLVALFAGLIGILLVETFALHFLLMQWSTAVAWVISGISLYTCLQIFAHARALTMRKTTFENGQLLLRYGLFGDAKINMNDFAKVEITKRHPAQNSGKIVQLALLPGLETHNIAIYFKSPQTIERIYGIRQKCDVLLLHLDNKADFLLEVNRALKSQRVSGNS